MTLDTTGQRGYIVNKNSYVKFMLSYTSVYIQYTKLSDIHVKRCREFVYGPSEIIHTINKV